MTDLTKLQQQFLFAMLKTLLKRFLLLKEKFYHIFQYLLQPLLRNQPNKIYHGSVRTHFTGEQRQICDLPH